MLPQRFAFDCSEYFLPLFLQMENTPTGNWALYLFSKGSLSLQTHLFPWKNGSVSKKSFRWAQLLEGSGEQDRAARRRKSSGGLCHHGGLMLLSSHTGPSIQLWKRCYLRGNTDLQVKDKNHCREALLHAKGWDLNIGELKWRLICCSRHF